MSDEVDAAAEALYGVALSAFTTERKRLADQLKAAGSKASAAVVAKLPRPSMSAWVVNRLWREWRAEMEALLEAGGRAKDGDREGLAAQRAAMARLRGHAAAVLSSDDHAASPATIQRVATTLQALSALGTWDPDQPGRLVDDRDPPGFDVMLGATLAPVAREPEREPAKDPRPAPVDELAARRPRDDRASAEKAERAEKEERERATRARVRAAERALLERAVEGMRRAVVQRTADVANAEAEIQVAETALERARGRLGEATRVLAEAEQRVADAESALGEHDDADGR